MGFVNDDKLTWVKWDKPLVMATRGVFSGNAALMPSKGTKFTDNVDFTTTATSSFTFLPAEFKILAGFKDLKIRFAPK
jgi:hypothetical protein